VVVVMRLLLTFCVCACVCPLHVHFRVILSTTGELATTNTHHHRLFVATVDIFLFVSVLEGGAFLLVRHVTIPLFTCTALLALLAAARHT
jgi:hypothetical protein